MELIDKSALVAEIENRIKELQILHKENEEKLDSIQKTAILLCIDECKVILSIVNTIEIKEVDLEKEINKYISNNFFGSQTIGFYANRTKEEPNDRDIALVAKHFFELGLKTKGE